MKFIYLSIILFSILTIMASRLKTNDSQTQIEKCKQRCKMGSNGFPGLDFSSQTDTIIPYTNTYTEKVEKDHIARFDFICQCLDYKFFHKSLSDKSKDEWTFNLSLNDLGQDVKKGKYIPLDNKSDTTSDSYLKPLLEKLIPQQKEKCNVLCREGTNQEYFGGILFYERHPKEIIGDKAGCKCLIKEMDWEMAHLRQNSPNLMSAIANAKGEKYKQDLIENYKTKVAEALKGCKNECNFSPKLYESVRGQTENLVCDCMVDTLIVNINTSKFTKIDNKTIKESIKNKKLFQLVQ